ncbi:hypothetical protein Pint_33978 [Pistacia integerrima]|uniref:Uncharacterized protein n=1 Tax=Pistacia integerrima TaxID=434235 RepID=A0ACC0X7N7_9ROSI|nr:hypothetical protein Pint_33978 [Pistacia integerrima]
MSDSEMGGVKEEKGKEDKDHQLEAKDPPSSQPENPDSIENVEDSDVKSVGLATDDNPASVDDQTLTDVQPCDNVDGLHGKDEDAKMESVDKNDKADESVVDNKDLVEPAAAAKAENDVAAVDETANELSHSKDDGGHEPPSNQLDCVASDVRYSEIKAENDEKDLELNGVAEMELSPSSEVKEPYPHVDVGCEVGMKSSNLSFLYEPPVAEGDESGTEEEQAAFVKEVENFYKERSLEFKHPKFYKEDLNLLKLWRAVIKLGGYEEVTSCKLWRQVGESFNPPK